MFYAVEAAEDWTGIEPIQAKLLGQPLKLYKQIYSNRVSVDQTSVVEWSLHVTNTSTSGSHEEMS